MSSPSAAAIAQELIASAVALRTQIICDIALTALLIYDMVLTTGQEYRYVWRSSKSWVSRVLYVWNRYLPLLYFILQLGSLPSMSDTSCAALDWLTVSVLYLCLLGPAMFTTLRIYALSRKNWALGGIALVLSLVPFAINVTNYHWLRPVNLPAPYNCQYSNINTPRVYKGADPIRRPWGRMVITSRSCLILVDSLAVAVTWFQARSANVFKTSAMRRPSLERVMWQNGIVYFCALVSLNIVDMILVILSITIAPGQAAYIIVFIDPLSSILNSRFLLALHETNARLAGASSTISSLSLDINSGGGPRDVSPDLPGFLSAVGGPIHSFPDHEDEGSDWGTLQFVASMRGSESGSSEAETECGTEEGVESGAAIKVGSEEELA